MNFPTRNDIKLNLMRLVEDQSTKKQVADWAIQYIINDKQYALQDDLVVWRFLKLLSGADLMDSPTSYLHEQEDFIAWLSDFQNGCAATAEPVKRNKRESIIPFEEFEKAVMQKILEKKINVNEILREQYKRSRVIKRDFTGAGFFTYLKVSDDAPRVTGLISPSYGDVIASINGSTFDFGFALFLGSVDFLT